MSLPSQYPRPLIDLGNIAGLYEHQHELHCYCVRCRRWSVLDLGRMVRDGKGSLRLPLSVRCQDCGDVGELQVRPPIPSRNSKGWIAPP